MLDEFQNELEYETAIDDVVSVNKMKEYINNLVLYTSNKDLLTNYYTELLLDDNAVFIFTRLSQNPVFTTHFPEFYVKNEMGESVINCQQNSRYHRFGVFKHILFTIEYVGKNNLRLNKEDLKIIKWTMLLHDIGKPFVKVVNPDGSDSFAGHEDVSRDMASVILDRFSFTDYEKEVILTLIKYHDKYLNDGELTQDNLTFLAQELQDKKELFELLIEVKIADNKAKSFDANNRFEAVVPKYKEFVNEYFSKKQKNVENDKKLNLSFDIDDEIISSNNSNIEYVDFQDDNDINLDLDLDKPIVNELIETNSSIEFTDKIFDKIYNGIVDGINIIYYYQPIIDVKNKKTFGYEVFPKVKNEYEFSMAQIYKKAKELDKYDKIQQILLINSINAYNDTSKIGKFEGHFNIDIASYKSYINKPRLFEMIADKDIVIEFSNHQRNDYTSVNEILSEFKKRKCKCLLENIGSVNTDFIDYYKKNEIKYELMEENLTEDTINIIKSLLNSCNSDNTKLIVNGVKNREILTELIKIGVIFVQGEFIGKILDSMDMTESKLEEILDIKIEPEDTIV